MKIGPDGSLCRITSSAKDSFNNIRIVKVPDDQLKEYEPSYRLVVIGAENTECESPSEKSDEEISDEDICHMQLPAKNFEKEKDTDSKIDKFVEIIKEKEETVKEHNNNKRHRSNYYQNNHNFFFKRNDKTFSKVAKNYNKSASNISSKEENNYKNYNSNKRNFNTSSNHGVAYSHPVQSASVDDIEPWLHPQFLLTPAQSFPYPVVPSHFTNGMEPVRQSPIHSHPENSAMSFGLLGDSPYASSLPNFQPNNQNDSYIHDQNSPFPPVPSSNHTDNFIHNQNYWNNEYPKYPNNYQPVPSNTSIPVPSHQNNFYQPHKKLWNGKNRRKRNDWNRKQRKPQNGRRNPPDHFDYRN